MVLILYMWLVWICSQNLMWYFTLFLICLYSLCYQHLSKPSSFCFCFCLCVFGICSSQNCLGFLIEIQVSSFERFVLVFGWNTQKRKKEENPLPFLCRIIKHDEYGSLELFFVCLWFDSVEAVVFVNGLASSLTTADFFYWFNKSKKLRVMEYWD